MKFATSPRRRAKNHKRRRIEQAKWALRLMIRENLCRAVWAEGEARRLRLVLAEVGLLFSPR